MNTNWRNRPTAIDFIPKSIGHIISIDESGSSSLKQVIKAKNNGSPLADSEKHFTVTACTINMKNFAIARDMVMNLKHKYWKDALFTYKSGVKRVCFHSREIRNRRVAFNPEIIDHPSFIADLSSLMANIPMTLYASHIDKERHVNQYKYPDSPYDLCMVFVLERVLYDLDGNDSCIIVLESRGRKEDRELLTFIKYLLNHGSRYNPATFFSRIKGVYFNPKWCRIENDRMSYWELELADLCAYPIQKYFVYGKKDKAFKTLLPKISSYPNVNGKGLKSFP